MDKDKAMAVIEQNLKERKNKEACYNACRAWDIRLYHLANPYDYEEFPEILKLLLEVDDIHLYNEYSLRQSVRHNNIGLFKTLIKMGADVNCWENVCMSTATGNSCKEIVEILLDNGANHFHPADQPLKSSLYNGTDAITTMLLDCYRKGLKPRTPKEKLMLLVTDSVFAGIDPANGKELLEEYFESIGE